MPVSCRDDRKVFRKKGKISVSKIVDSRQIGAYTVSISDDGAIGIEVAGLHEPLKFDAGQAQELRQWLVQSKDALSSEVSSAVTPPAPALDVVESSEEMAQRVINEAIVLAREHYPAGLNLENRDRFIDQITRDPAIKPLVAQGKISRKQIMLWIEQSTGGSAPSLWTQDKKRGR
jgi:hypothetical protein